MRVLLAAFVLVGLILAVTPASASGVDRCVGKPSTGMTCVNVDSDSACTSNQAGLQGSTTCVSRGSNGYCVTYDATFQHYGTCTATACGACGAIPARMCTTDFLGMNGGGACVDTANPRGSCFWIDHPVTVGGC